MKKILVVLGFFLVPAILSAHPTMAKANLLLPNSEGSSALPTSEPAQFRPKTISPKPNYLGAFFAFMSFLYTLGWFYETYQKSRHRSGFKKIEPIQFAPDEPQKSTGVDTNLLDFLVSQSAPPHKNFETFPSLQLSQMETSFIFWKAQETGFGPANIQFRVEKN